MSAVLTLVRHGRTAHNAAGRLQGYADVPLDEVGLTQAARVARRLAREAPRVTRIFSSDLTRAAQTAAAIGAATDVSVETSPQLREISVGIWEGRRMDELALEEPAAFAAWPITYAPPGGETVGEAGARLRRFFDELTFEHGEHVVLVSHGAAITGMLASLLSWDLAEVWRERRGDHVNTALTQLDVSGKGAPGVRVLACARHLEDASFQK
ncbi:histidine phosphatase family protein [Deinococcus yavapaiensis]|uniref:Putative phosphoglycerate mutase n=1 Tax=Deinococcus yavapaiensis KR-236 TaxID=694435 RepID=A0A318S983_9DEIO|nr:histidine phosphatase family protein [Deinococcus yavapaiensis]PYE54778.1 putative phosphoglycerate mutase [Deinococcus yavapaiensis KR-236]